jgi:hypothetical protein
VLDRRLPPRLAELSDRPEGSLANPLKPDQDIVGSIAADDGGAVDLVLVRAKRGAAAPVWLFSRQTLERIPAIFDEIDLLVLDQYFPAFLIKPRLAGVRLAAYLSARAGGTAAVSRLPRVAQPACCSDPRSSARGGRAGGRVRQPRDPRRPSPAADRDGDPLAPGRGRTGAAGTRLLVRGCDRPHHRGGGLGAAAGERRRQRYLHRRLRVSVHAEMAAMLRLGRRVADAIALRRGRCS